MALSLFIHIVLLLCATLWVVSSVRTQRKAQFKGGDNAGAAVQHPVKMSNTQPHLDTLTKRLSVDNANSAVALPDLPTTPDSGPAAPLSNTSLGAAGAVGGLKGPLMPSFGFHERLSGGSLVGRLYDLKQLKTGSANPAFQKLLATEKGNAPYDDLIAKEVGAFIQNGCRPEYLDAKFYRATDPLYATQIFVPDTPADEAPKAYGAEKTVKPKCWIAHYRGRVSPPTNGVYRFVGGGDDVIVVRLDGRLVLDGGIVNVSGFKTDRPERPAYPYDFGPQNAMGSPYLNQRRGGFVVGHRMELRAGLFYDIDVIIGESPGGFFFANLLVEKEGDTYAKDGHGNPVLPIFRIADTPPPSGNGLRMPPHADEGPIWRTLPLPGGG